MTKKTLFAIHMLVCGLALAQGLVAPVLAAPSFDAGSQRKASHSVDACLPATCVADARVVHHRRPPPRHHYSHNHHRATVVVVRPVRPWARRPYYGGVVAGVVLGTVIVASTVPPAPSTEVCWYWSSSAQSRGYWDYCKPR